MQKTKRNKGFSLIEIMLVVSIMAVMIGGIVIGFGGFTDRVRLREVAGVIQNTLQNLELEMIQKSYQKQTVHFKEDFLLIESALEDQSLSLNWKGIGGACGANEIELEIDNTASAEAVLFTKRDAQGNNLKTTSIPPATLSTECVDFQSSLENEIHYQLSQKNQFSQIIRLIHFNLKRDEPQNNVQISSGNHYALELSSPYASKTFYDNSTLTTGTVSLTLSSEDNSEVLILQE